MVLEYVPGDSFLHRMDPRTKIILFFMVIVFTVVVYDPFVIGVVLLFIVILYKVAKIPMEELTTVLKPVIPAFFLFILLNFFVSPPRGAKIYFYLIPPLKAGPVSVATAMVGISAALRFTLFIILSRLLTLVTPISRLLVALTKMGLPVEAAVSLGIAFASIPLMVDQFRTVKQAQQSKGAKFEVKNPVKKMFSFVPVIVPSIFLTILRGRDIARTLESRAFTYNPKKRTFREKLEITGLDYSMIALGILLVIPLVYLNIFRGWFDYLFIYQLLRTRFFPFLPL